MGRGPPAPDLGPPPSANALARLRSTLGRSDRRGCTAGGERRRDSRRREAAHLPGERGEVRGGSGHPPGPLRRRSRRPRPSGDFRLTSCLPASLSACLVPAYLPACLPNSHRCPSSQQKQVSRLRLVVNGSLVVSGLCMWSQGRVQPRLALELLPLVVFHAGSLSCASAGRAACRPCVLPAR